MSKPPKKSPVKKTLLAKPLPTTENYAELIGDMNWSDIKSKILSMDEASLRNFLYSGEVMKNDRKTVMKIANILRLNKKYDKALNLTDMILEKCEKCEELIELLYLRGDIYMDAERFEDAIMCYSLLIDIKPQDIAHNNRGVAYWEIDKYDHALGDFLNSIKINSNNKFALRGAGEISMILKLYKDAEKYLKMALDIDPSYSNALEALKDLKSQKISKQSRKKA